MITKLSHRGTLRKIVAMLCVAGMLASSAPHPITRMSAQGIAERTFQVYPVGDDHLEEAGTAGAPTSDQGLTVLVLNNALDVHHETGAFYGLTHLLNEMGIPFDTPAWYTGFSQLDPAVYPLVIINDYVDQEETSFWQENALNTYVTNGGVVIAPQVMDAELQSLFGLTNYSEDKRTFFIEFTGSSDASMRYINRPEERTIRLGDPALYTEIYDPVYTYTVSSDTQMLANALNRDSVSVGPTIVKHTLGTGKTYALGFSFFGLILRSESNRDPEAQRVYIDGFEPGADVIRLFVRAIYEEATGGHFILKHTVPGPHDSALIITHDVDAWDAYYDDVDPDGWGRAVARQFADLEVSLGVTTTYLFTTKNITDSYGPGFWYTPTVKYICDKGFDCQSHGVQHSNMITLPVGTCNETFKTYDPLNNPTLCGELRVSKELVEAVTGKPVVCFRSPFLGFHWQLPETLERCGYQCDSSFSAPDVLTNYPYVLMESTLFTTPTNVIELPVALADDALGPKTAEQVLNKWKTVIDANAENYATNVLLIHPSIGLVCEADPDCHNAAFKLDAEQRIISYARGKNLLISNMTLFYSFWHARDGVHIRASHDSAANRYTGVLTNTGSKTISGLTLALGNPVHLESHTSPYPVTTTGNKIVFEQVAPGQVISFTAVHQNYNTYLPLVLKQFAPTPPLTPWVTIETASGGPTTEGEVRGQVGPPSYCNANYKVALYAKQDMWYVQPYDDSRRDIAIGSNCTWQSPTQAWKEIGAHLVRAGFYHPSEIGRPTPPCPPLDPATDPNVLAASCYP